ncbi:hypothetical protein MmarC5_1166 [Methanococcus maripaludis C5]|uniref:Uncharacterized protein n=2 Tax=Methanococcus maripaludis TaxID=39152 RepID=A4FZ30_METM5|nr:hypothetical protein MmarC5_1166 [Methanococcus maripaludis C5]
MKNTHYKTKKRQKGGFMSYEKGFIKYIVKTPLTLVGFASMYIFGGTILTIFHTISELFSGHFVNAFLQYFLFSALPPTSISQVVVQVAIGSSIAGIKWYVAMKNRQFRSYSF